MKNTKKNSSTAYQGYKIRRQNKPDDLLTDSNFGTPLGEYMRCFWQPVALASQVTRLPKKLKIFNEDLVVFRDGKNQIGLMQLHCAHRGASLEFGVTQESGGIKCCYHGIHFDITGEILEIPSEPDGGKRVMGRFCQPAYPTIERDGLIFAYFGNPDTIPEFEEWDSFSKENKTELVAFSNIYPCNWLQVIENIADQMHTATLHQPMTLYDGELPKDIDFDYFTLPSFSGIPVLDYHAVRENTAMAFVAGRRMSEKLVWWRINECILPNLSHHAYLYEKGNARRVFHRVHMARWYVPVDNENSIIFGWRMFGPSIDPDNMGNMEQVGYDSIDFLGGQVAGSRTHKERQMLPGDFEALVGQGKIASRVDEHRLSGDKGVVLFRKILSQALLNENIPLLASMMHLDPSNFFRSYSQNSILNIQSFSDAVKDKENIEVIGKKIIAIMASAPSAEPQRTNFVMAELEKLET